MASFYSLRFKLGLVIGLSTFLASGMLITYTTTTAREQAIKAAHESSSAVARDYAGQVKAEIEKGLTSARTMAQTFSSIKDKENPLPLNRAGAYAILKNVLEQNNSFYGTFTSWEPDAFDGQDSAFVSFDTGHDPSGRFIPYWFKDGNKAMLEPTMGYDKDAYYTVPETTGKELIIDPVNYTVNGASISLITIVAPVLRNGHFYGLAGVDIATDWMQQMASNHTLYGGRAIISIISNNGTIAASSLSDTLVGKKLEKLFPQYDEQLAALKAGTEGSVLSEDYLKVHTPFRIGNSETPWQVSIEIPREIILADADRQLWEMIIISFALLLGALAVILFVVQRTISPLGAMVKMTERVAQGDLSEPEIKSGKDEIGQMSQAFKQLMASLRKTSDFAKQIGQGNLEADFQALSEKDELGLSLIAMRNSLKSVAEEDKKRKWVTEGLAKFGDILRSNNDNLEQLSDIIISELVKYLKVNQGAMFTLAGNEDEAPYLELTATYAWNRKKYFEKRFPVGQGLVGQVVLEKEHIYITDVPKDFISITSGLGEATPTAILIMPLKINEAVIGVIELASFHQLEEYEIDFVAKIGENIALTLSTVRINQTTRRLLEEARTVTEEKRATEEELLQNQEELQATQEEMNRTIQELRNENERLKQRVSLDA